MLVLYYKEARRRLQPQVGALPVRSAQLRQHRSRTPCTTVAHITIQQCWTCRRSTRRSALNQRRQMESGAVWASQILPDLFLGRGADASNKAQLRAHGVTHVLNCADNVPGYFGGFGEFTYCATSA